MDNSVLKQISELDGLPKDQLRERWTALFGSPPAVDDKRVLVSRLAYRIQELKFGGLSKQTVDRLNSLSITVDTVPQKRGMPLAGTRYIRVWRGTKYEVTVTNGGYEFEGRPYRSLTAIAKDITGAHWNGNLFFGVRKCKPHP
jgi:hypothetical protein